jgi:cytochrome c peroxidase
VNGWICALALGAAMAASNARAAPVWSPEDLAVLKSLSLRALPPRPADPSNRAADSRPAARLGEALFFDRQLSANCKVSCASCHQPGRGFTDATAVGHGMATGSRRTMPVAVAAYSPWQFWDGRADSLWSQALGPVENPAEHGFTRTEVVSALATRYRAAYARSFEPLPHQRDLARLPMRASPGGDGPAQAAWATMATADQAAVNAIFANFGKAIAAYERTLPIRPSRFDLYVAGLSRPRKTTLSMTPNEVAGLRLFIGKAQCSTCHNGPLMTTQGFANTGVPPRLGRSADWGRALGVRKAADDPFNCLGAYSDASRDRCEELEFAVLDSPVQVGAFKVPSLRGVSQRAPYMHAGQLTSLRQVVDHYNRAPKAAAGVSEIRPLNLSQTERRQIVAFLQTLDDPSITKP